MTGIVSALVNGEEKATVIKIEDVKRCDQIDDSSKSPRVRCLNAAFWEGLLFVGGFTFVIVIYFVTFYAGYHQGNAFGYLSMEHYDIMKFVVFIIFLILLLEITWILHSKKRVQLKLTFKPNPISIANHNVLRMRVAGKNMFYIEVAYNKTEAMTYNDLKDMCCKNLVVNPNDIAAIAKRNILIRNDDDVARLDKAEFIEVILKVDEV